MSGSARHLQYGAPCAAVGNGSEAQPASAAANSGNWSGEHQHPGGSIDIDAAHICEHAQCPFPLHDAFEHKEGRLRNQVISSRMGIRCCIGLQIHVYQSSQQSGALSSPSQR